MLHDANYTLDDIIDIGKVTLAVSIVKDLDGLAITKLVGESEVGHIRTACRSIYSEETKTC